MRKVYVSIFGILADMFFVCELKRRELYAFGEIRELTEELRLENLRLQESSLTDSLTGIRNRLALRQGQDRRRRHGYARLTPICGLPA